MEITPRPQAKIALHIILACLKAIGLKVVTGTKDTCSVKKECLFLRIVEYLNTLVFLNLLLLRKETTC